MGENLSKPSSISSAHGGRNRQKNLVTVVRAAKPPAPAELHAKEMADATKELMHLQKEPADWPMQEGNYAGWRYSPL